MPSQRETQSKKREITRINKKNNLAQPKKNPPARQGRRNGKKETQLPDRQRTRAKQRGEPKRRGDHNNRKQQLKRS